MKPTIYRQGDVLLLRVEAMPDSVERVKRDQGRIVLAYGEVTGHAHAIADKAAELYAVPGHEQELEDRFLQVLAEGGVDLVHEEHGTITLPKGGYVVRRQREYSPAEIRTVSD